MTDSLLKHVGVFANPNGSNAFTKDFLRVFAPLLNSPVSIIGLAEKLPEYARFPSEQRKTRLEEVMRAAATSAVKDVVNYAKECSLQCDKPAILNGRFPTALLHWIDSTPTTLLIKESLACDGNFSNASKGDLKLTRHSSAPVLLAHAPVQEGDAVLVGIAPLPGDTTHDRFCIRLVQVAADFARTFGGSLCVVHAWDLWGEGLLRNRVPKEEIEEGRADTKRNAEQALERVLSQCELDGVVPERLLGRGDPTRVIAGAVDLVKPGLVVLGSTAKEGVKGTLLGNTAEAIARQKHSSVLIIR